MELSSPSFPAGNRLRINLLGPPLIQWAGKMLEIPRRQVRGFLYYLAAQNAPATRATLCLLFWPEHCEVDARRNLTRALTHLRRALPVAQVLVTDENLVFLDERQVWCDAVEFRKLIVQEKGGETLQRALDLYRGPFLEGFYLPNCPDFEAWVTQERADFEASYLGGLSALMNVQIAGQDYASAIQSGRRYLETDVLSEDIHRRLIGLYALTGDRARALRQFENCLATLENELAARPLPETQAVYRAVLEGRQPDLLTQPDERVYPFALKSLRLDVPLIGRASACQHIQRVQEYVRSGQSRMVLVSGEAGIGKSRLLYHFASTSRLYSQVLFGAGQAGERSVPYYPIVEALRSAMLTHPIPLAAHWAAEVARLLPDLAEIFPDLPPPFSLKGEEARLRLFDALTQYLVALQADRGPLLLCLDDLHWFDRTSLNWLVHLARQLSMRSSKILVIGTYRSDEAGQVEELRQNLSRLGLLDEIGLEGWDTRDILELLNHVSQPQPASETLAARLAKATAGNPLFILETLQALEEAGALSEKLGEPVDFPLTEKVRQVVNWRLDRLNPISRQVLEAGAVLGASFRFKTLQATAGRSDLETSLSLDTLVNRRLIIAEDEAYRFSHELLRRVAVNAISPQRRRILHARAGKALEKLAPQDMPVLAQHFEAAGEFQKALHFYELSAQQAEALFAWQEAEALLKRMQEIILRLDASGNPHSWIKLHSWVLSKMVQIHYLQGSLVERDADLQMLDDLAGNSENTQVELQAILLKAQQWRNDARYRDVIAVVERGLKLAPPVSVMRGRLLALDGFAYLLLGQPQLSLQALHEAQTCVQANADLELRAVVADNMGMVHRFIGNHATALEYYQEAFECRRRFGDPYAAARYVEIGFLLTNLCRFDEARLFLEDSLANARRAGALAYEGNALLALGGWHLYQGNAWMAIETYLKVLEILNALRNVNLSNSAKTFLGFAYYHLADLDQSRRWLVDSLAQSQVIGHKISQALANILLGLVEISADNLTEARGRIEKGLAIAQEVQSKEVFSAGLAATARLERLSADPKAAIRLAEEALCNMQALQLTGLEVWVRVEAALALADLQERESAWEYILSAVLLIPKAHQLWITNHQVSLAYARIAKVNQPGQTADEQARELQSLILSRAAAIPDADQRQAYLRAFEPFVAGLSLEI